MVRSTCDSKAWAHINNTWFDFATDKRNIKLVLTLDGVNPYVDLLTNHSPWPILLQNYNLSPWLLTKHFFVMLTLLILDP